MSVGQRPDRIDMRRCDHSCLLSRSGSISSQRGTSISEEAGASHAQEAGAFQFLNKPVDFDFLKQQLRQLPAASL